jgi:hypothetical protein
MDRFHEVAVSNPARKGARLVWFPSVGNPVPAKER